MKQKRTFVALLLIIAILCLGIAYAEISGVVLKITGNVTATPAEGTIDVKFTEAAAQEGSEDYVSPTISTDGKTVTMDVSGLTTEKDSATVVCTIENQSTDMAATLGEPSVSWTETDWFDVTCTPTTTESLAKNGEEGDSTTKTVTVTLKKTPVKTEITDTMTITIQADPVEN